MSISIRCEGYHDFLKLCIEEENSIEEVKISCQTISSACCLPANYLLQVSLFLNYCLSLRGNYRILKMQLSYSSFLKLTHLLQDRVEKSGEGVGGEGKRTSSMFLMFGNYCCSLEFLWALIWFLLGTEMSFFYFKNIRKTAWASPSVPIISRGDK